MLDRNLRSRIIDAHAILSSLAGGLVVSCQPVPGSPFDTVEGVTVFARAAESAGARGLRIEGAQRVSAVVAACRVPVIGLVKRDLPGFDVRITPLIEDVDALLDAGASIVAVDATQRPRPVPVAALLARIRADGRAAAMADCATLADAAAALAAGAHCVGSTMAGYTGGPVPALPDLVLVRAMSALGAPVLAEGRYNSPELAADAIRAGASAVVVGSAITRPEHVTGWFRDAVAGAARRAGPVLAFDIGGTKTLAALVLGGDVLDRRVAPTDRAVGAPGWAEGLARLAEGWPGRYSRAAVAVTGVVSAGRWSALNAGILAVPPGFPLRDRLQAALGVPVVVINDGQAAAWGEYRHGAGERHDMVFVTVSSGIGGGVVTGGRLLRGSGGLAGSLGQFPCHGRPLEARASGFAIAADAQRAGYAADTPAVFAAARAGTPWANTILGEAASALAEGLIGLQAIVDPECVVIGGGVGLADGFLDRVRAALQAHPPACRPVLKRAALGVAAGVVGAADIARAPVA